MRRTLAIALIVQAVLSGAGDALALDESVAREQRAPRRGYWIEPAPLGLRLTTPAFGLRLEFEPRQLAPSYESPFRAGPDQALRFWRLDLGQAEGWSAFGAYGPMRFSKEFNDNSDTTLRFGGSWSGAPVQSDRLDLGIRYRIRF